MNRPHQGFALWKTLAGVVCLVGLGTATYAVSSLQITGVSPDADAWLNKRQVPITVKYQGVVGSCVLSVDGHPLATEVHGDAHEIVATATDLKDGEHQIDLEAGRALGIGHVERNWKLNVDTKTPTISVSTPAPGTIVKDRLLRIEGRTKPDARLTVKDVGEAGHKYELPVFNAEHDGTFHALVKMSDDKNKIRIDAVDRAGNHGQAVRSVICDLSPPEIRNIYPAPEATIKLNPTVTITADVSEKGSGIKRAVLTVDGKTHDITLEPTGGKVSFKAEELPEGTREVSLEVEDRAGWKAVKSWKFLVNTSEMFGERPMTKGAIGQDVAMLQKRLIHRGLLAEGHVTSIYDDDTAKAVQDLQAQHNQDVDGVLGMKTIALLSPRILVNLSTFTLTLKDGDEVIKTYGIACGQPRFPTPTGHFHVTYLEKNPTWIPPKDSVWAREAKVTPPGPGNPLGTRWIGLDSNAVGIHGTPAAWSIGSRASHGCIRMRIPDVEDLFSRINPGTHVSIFNGTDPLGEDN